MDEQLRRFVRCLEKDEWPGYRHPDQPDKDLAFTVRVCQELGIHSGSTREMGSRDCDDEKRGEIPGLA